MSWLRHGLRTKFHDLFHTNLAVFKLLHAYCLKHRVKAFLLVLFLVSISWLESMVHSQGDDIFEFRKASSNEFEILELIIRNLTNKGMLGMLDKGLIVDHDNESEKLVDSSHIVQNKKVDMISYSDLERKQSSIEYKYGFAFIHEGIEELVDKVLKVDGILVIQIKGNLVASESSHKPSNYETVYPKKFEPRFNVTTMTMKKIRIIDDKNDASNTSPHRRLMFTQRKAEAIKNLENVLLEPPRVISGKSSTYSKKTRYLPDLMHDSLEDYPRRVFIDVNGDGGWFTKNYPTRNMNFDIYQVETTIPDTDTDSAPMESLMEIEITDWLRENVKNDEYVVMKAEADVVEQLINNKEIELVDELFLECKYQCMKCKKCRRPYWKCLALYGSLKDVGVAVHQWWG